MADTLLHSDFLPAERMPYTVLQDWSNVLRSWPPLPAIMDQSACPTVLLNEQRQAVYCNPAFIELTGFALPSALLGLRPGEALGCVNAEQNAGGCGTSVNCQSCQLAKAIVDALAWGEGTGFRELRVLRDQPAKLMVRLHTTSVVVGTGRFLLCRLGDFSPLAATYPSDNCPVELRELYLALTEPPAD